MNNAIIKAASTAVSNKVIQQTATRAVKTAAPVIARAAVKTVANAVKNNTPRQGSKVQTTKTSRRARSFAPVAYSTDFTNSSKVVRIRQSEIVAEINPSLRREHWWSPNKTLPNQFTVSTYPISPSNATTFPWLSNIAGLFDKFRFRSLSFSFVSTRPTSTQGNIAMAVDYDAYDTAPASIIDMSNLAKFTTTPVYVNKTIQVPITHPGSTTWYYCDDGQGGDKKTYNLANVYVALSGVNDTNSHGYLVVNYDVELVDKNPVSRTVKTSVNEDTGVFSTTLVGDDLDATAVDTPRPISQTFFYVKGHQTNYDPPNAGDWTGLMHIPSDSQYLEIKNLLPGNLVTMNFTVMDSDYSAGDFPDHVMINGQDVPLSIIATNGSTHTFAFQFKATATVQNVFLGYNYDPSKLLYANCSAIAVPA